MTIIFCHAEHIIAGTCNYMLCDTMNMYTCVVTRTLSGQLWPPSHGRCAVHLQAVWHSAQRRAISGPSAEG